MGASLPPLRKEIKKMIGITKHIGEGFASGELYDVLLSLQLESGLLPISGKTYFVSQMGNGTDGLTWETAFTTLSAAITASNTWMDSTGASRISRNRIFVDGTNYAGLTVLPKHCDIIGVGTNPRINAASAIATAVDGCHIYNMKFRSLSTASPVFATSVATNGLEFHGCYFDSASTTCAQYLKIFGNQTIKIINCIFSGTHPAAVGIQIDSSFMFSEITGNTIMATTSGIVIGSAVLTLDYNSYIRDNIISYVQSTGQMTYGIDIQSAGGASRIMLVHNWISAADAIHYADGYGDRSAWQCINNHIVQATTGSTETPTS